MHEKQDESNGRKLLAEPLIFRQTVDSCIDYKRSCRVQLQPNFVNKENIHTHTSLWWTTQSTYRTLGSTHAGSEHISGFWFDSGERQKQKDSIETWVQ